MPINGMAVRDGILPIPNKVKVEWD